MQISTLRGFSGQVGKGGRRTCSRPNERGWGTMRKTHKGCPTRKARRARWKMQAPSLLPQGRSLSLSLSFSPHWPSLGLTLSMKLSTTREPLFTPLFWELTEPYFTLNSVLSFRPCELSHLPCVSWFVSHGIGLAKTFVRGFPVTCGGKTRMNVLATQWIFSIF